MSDPPSPKKKVCLALTESPDSSGLSSQSTGQINTKQDQQTDDIITIDSPQKNMYAFLDDQLPQFQPPNCKCIPRRKVDRICLNKRCNEKYMELICKKCHEDKHKAAIDPEILIPEFFQKLVEFIHEQKEKNRMNKETQQDDSNHEGVQHLIQMISEGITQIKQKFSILKENLNREIQISSSEYLTQGIIRSLSLCEFDNIQTQIDSFLKIVIFDKDNNKFNWNSRTIAANTSFSQVFETSFKTIEESLNVIQQNIIKYFSFDKQQDVDLSKLKCYLCEKISIGKATSKDQLNGDNKENKKILQSNQIFGNQQGISLSNEGSIQRQWYLDYKLDLLKAYRLIIRFEIPSNQQFISIGVMPYSMVKTNWLCCPSSQSLFQRFPGFINSSAECSKVLKEVDLENVVDKHTQFQIKVDFQNNILEFSEFPDKKHLTTSKGKHKLNNKDPYVFVFVFSSTQHIAIEGLQEIQQKNK